LAIGIGIGSLLPVTFREGKSSTACAAGRGRNDGIRIFDFGARIDVCGGNGAARRTRIFRRLLVVPVNALIQHRPEESQKGSVIAFANLLSFVGFSPLPEFTIYLRIFQRKPGDVFHLDCVRFAGGRGVCCLFAAGFVVAAVAVDCDAHALPDSYEGCGERACARRGDAVPEPRVNGGRRIADCDH